MNALQLEETNYEWNKQMVENYLWITSIRNVLLPLSKHYLFI